MLRTNHLLTATIALATLLVLAITSHAQTTAPADESAGVTEAQVPGDLILVRWDVVLNDTGLEPIKELDTPEVPTTSHMYKAMSWDANMLRANVNQAMDNKGVEKMTTACSFTRLSDGVQDSQFVLNYTLNNASHLTLSGGGPGTEQFTDTHNGRAALKLNFPGGNIQLSDAHSNDVSSIAFDGDIGPGEAVAFLASFTAKSGVAYNHLVVWEAFKAEQWQLEYIRQIQSSKWWCRHGPDGARNAANVAVVWLASGMDTDQPHTFIEHKSSDGKTIRVLGSCKVDRWPFCWWDAQGKAVRVPSEVTVTDGHLKNPLYLNIEITGPSSELTKEGPHGQPSNNSGQGQPGEFRNLGLFWTSTSGETAVVVPVGDWKLVGTIPLNGSIDVDGVTYRLDQINAAGDSAISVHFFHNTPDNAANLVTVCPVKKDGTEIDPSWLPQMTGRKYADPVNQIYQGISLDEVQSYHVWKRKRQSVMFGPLPLVPPKAPPTTITAADVAAARQVIADNQSKEAQREAQQREQASADQLKQWETGAADPSTAMGALRDLYESATKGDLQAVRQRMVAPSDVLRPAFEAYSRFITASIHARAIVLQRFGDAATATDSPTSLHMLDFAKIWATTPWQSRADGGLEYNDFAVVKGSDGQYYVDASALLQRSSPQRIAHFVQPMADRLELIAKTLTDNPTMSLDQLTQTLQSHPTSRPAVNPQ
jgi:hypothetical protein